MPCSCPKLQYVVEALNVEAFCDSVAYVGQNSVC